MCTEDCIKGSILLSNWEDEPLNVREDIQGNTKYDLVKLSTGFVNLCEETQETNNVNQV